MTPFRKKSVDKSEHVGDILRSLRSERGWTIEDLAKNANIQVRYLKAFEDFRYHELPGLVYAKNFLRSIAKASSINATRLLDRFERDLVAYPYSNIAIPPSEVALPTFWTPKRLRAVLIVLVLFAGLAYLGFALKPLLVPPDLQILLPQDNIELSGSQVKVEGQTTQGVTITVNGAPIDVQDSGYFETTVDLNLGVNTLTIVAKHKFGRETQAERNIYVRSLQEAPTS